MDKYYLPFDGEYCVISQKNVIFSVFDLFHYLKNKGINFSHEGLKAYDYLSTLQTYRLYPNFKETQFSDFCLQILIYRKKLIKSEESQNATPIETITEKIKNLVHINDAANLLITELKKQKAEILKLTIKEVQSIIHLRNTFYYYTNHLRAKGENRSYINSLTEKSPEFLNTLYTSIYSLNQLLKNPFAGILKQWKEITNSDFILKHIEYIKNEIDEHYYHYVIYCDNEKKGGFWGIESKSSSSYNNKFLFPLDQAKLFQTEKQAKLYAKNTACLQNYAIVKVRMAFDNVMEMVGHVNTHEIDLFKSKEEKKYLEAKMQSFIPRDEDLLNCQPHNLAKALSILCEEDEEIKKVLDKYTNLSINQKSNIHKI